MSENISVNTDHQVLAASLKVHGAIERFAAEVNDKDVGYVHGVKGIHEIYKAMLAYHKATSLDIVDPVAFKSWLSSESDIYEAVGGESGMQDLYSTLMPIELPAVDAIIKMVDYRGRKRRRLDHVQDLQRLVSEADVHDERSQFKIAELTEEINNLYKDLEYDPLSVVRTAHDIIDGVGDLFEIPPFIKTPYKNLNKALGYTEDGGLFRGGVHAVVALSGYGKSTFTKCICNHFLDEGYTVLFVNFEEPQAHWERILMTQMTGVNIYAKVKELDSIQLSDLANKFTAKIKGWGDRLMVRHDPDTLFFEDLEVWMRDILGHGARKPDVVVIDTINSMFTKTGGRARWGDYEQIMVRLEKLAKDMDAAFVITAQQNINSTKDKREELNQGDMGGSITIGQKSTVSIFLTPQRGSKNEGDDISSEIMEAQITKNRITGVVFKDSPPLLRYDDPTKSYYEYDPGKEDSRYNVEEVDIEGDIY